ncbi:MAG: glycosyltransferase family 2 protein [Acidobacteria bacterium]|nr:MAG: glycosyltransferase family 2 protein [Acidobacteriota bacterium]
MISVVIGAFNAEEFIAEAIESVLSQSYKNFEVIVVDDGSTDNTHRVVESFSDRGVVLVTQENNGAAAARNRAIEIAKGDYLAFLDADDVWTEFKLESQLNELAADPSLDAVFGMMQQVFQADWDQATAKPIAPDTDLLKGITQATMLIKRESFNRIGPFSEERTVGEFVDWLLRAKEEGFNYKLMPDLHLRRRIHNNNLGIRARSEVNDYLRILKSSMDRRRIAHSEKNDDGEMDE